MSTHETCPQCSQCPTATDSRFTAAGDREKPGHVTQTSTDPERDLACDDVTLNHKTLV